ncbi:MAG: SxtJ family membrane protein [Desulfovibrionaceae bacterium]|nr:SxtJ family membrane protein [Desulfovibrionaceae bacterium]
MIDTKPSAKHGLFPKSVTRAQAADTGMAMVLICLLVGLWRGRPGWTAAAALLLVLNMTWPKAYAPLARVWLGLSQAMGALVSRLLLAAVFFVLVTPVGLARRGLGKDPMRLKKWKSGQDSVFVARDHQFKPEDVENPY